MGVSADGYNLFACARLWMWLTSPPRGTVSPFPVSKFRENYRGMISFGAARCVCVCCSFQHDSHVELTRLERCYQNPTTTPFFGLSHDNHDVSALSTHPDSVDMGFSALIEITDLLGGVHQLHRLTLDRNNLQHFLEQSRALASRIKAWNKSLPEAYTTLPEEDTKRVLVQLLYNAAQIKLHSLVSLEVTRLSDLTPRLTRIR